MQLEASAISRECLVGNPLLRIIIGGWGVRTTGKSISVSVRVVLAGAEKLREGDDVPAKGRAKSYPKFPPPQVPRLPGGCPAVVP